MDVRYGEDPRYNKRRNQNLDRKLELKQKRELERKRQLQIRKQNEINLKRNFTLDLDLNLENDFLELKLESGESVLSDVGARCVFVATKTTLPAPDGRRVKKSFKGKSQIIKFRCTNFEKKFLKVKAKKCGLTLSEYIRKVAFEEKIIERLTDEQIDIYKMLVNYHNNFKSIGNMYKKRDSNLSEKVHQLADEIRLHLKKFRK
ncbi:mobilization protein MbpA [Aureibaculum sp. 2210JD6-5]|uniref:mobilization protein MbpA n=1 Tax=Aureibaculum sp. 2210JD6-5 TaxID=3103957 RepID=UPI002AAD9566|nr:mobilization protein MbpA [Aureibaculum sp. 2210JD6-5]MDY7396299.1 mobilization protein MbpA [Aureibaculum sp. 2210JD6-5]